MYSSMPRSVRMHLLPWLHLAALASLAIRREYIEELFHHLSRSLVPQRQAGRRLRRDDTYSTPTLYDDDDDCTCAGGVCICEE